MVINRFLALLLWIKSLEIDMPSKAILWSLAAYCNNKYEAFPSLTALAKDASIGKSTITRKLKKLEELNILTRKHRKYEKGGLMSTLYKLNIEIFIRELEDETNETKKKLIVEKIVPHRAQGMPGASIGVCPERATNISTMNTSIEYIQDQHYNTSSIEDEKASSSPDPSKKVGPIPYDEILAAFKEVLPLSPKPKGFTEGRKRIFRARVKGNEKRLTLEWWKNLFIYISQSPFLTGQVAKRDGTTSFMINFDWMLNATNFQKIIEGNYHQGAE